MSVRTTPHFMGAVCVFTFFATLAITSSIQEKALNETHDTHAKDGEKICAVYETLVEHMNRDHKNMKDLLVGQFKAVIELTGKLNDQRIRERVQEFDAEGVKMKIKAEEKKEKAFHKAKQKVWS